MKETVPGKLHITWEGGGISVHLPKTSQTRSKKEGLWVSEINSKVESKNIQLKILIRCPGGRNGFLGSNESVYSWYGLFLQFYINANINL